MIFVSSACSRMFAVQPTTRATAKVDVNSSRRHGRVLEDDRGPELDVGDEPALRVAASQLVEHDGLHLRRHLDAAPVEPMGDIGEELGTRVLRAIDGVAEARDAAVGVEFGVDPVARTIGGADGVEHVEHPARRATVTGAAQRTERGYDCRRHVGARRCDDTRGEGGSVEAVVDGRDQVLLEGADLGGGAGSAVQLPEVVGDDGKAGIGFDRLEPEPAAMQRGDDGRQHCCQGDRLLALVATDMSTMGGKPRAAPTAAMADRTSASGLPSRASCSITPATDAGNARWAATSAANAARSWSLAGRAPSIMRRHTSSNDCVRASSHTSYWR